ARMTLRSPKRMTGLAKDGGIPIPQPVPQPAWGHGRLAGIGSRRGVGNPPSHKVIFDGARMNLAATGLHLSTPPDTIRQYCEGGTHVKSLRLALAGLALSAVALAASGTVTFNKDVLPILQKNCQNCHRPGEVAPMSLLTYEQARPWAKAI